MALHLPRTLRTSLTVEWLLMSAALLTLVLWLAIPGQIPRANAWLQDSISHLQSRAPSPDVVLVVADDRSVATIGRWPWRRALHAQLLRQISEGQPQSIGLDIQFTEEDWDYPQDDWLLAQAIADSGRVALPVLRNMHGGSHNVTLPLSGLRSGAAQLGHVQLAPNNDGGVRRFYAYEGLGTAPWPHLALAMLCMAQPQALHCQPPSTDAAPDAGWQRQELTHIAFADGQPPFRTYAYIDVLRGDIPASAFRNKHVIVGVTATGLSSPWSTPGTDSLSSHNPELVAHILSGALQNIHTVSASTWANQLFNAIPVALALLALVLCGPSVALLLCIGLGLATLLATLAGALWWQITFSPAAAIVVLALAYPLWSWRRLNAAAHFLRQSMHALHAQGMPGLAANPLPTGDFLQHRIDAVSHASEQLRQLHQFVTETLLQLPSPTLACDAQGYILLANSAAHRYAHSLGRTLTPQQPIALLLEGAVERGTLQPLWNTAQPPSLHTTEQREGLDLASHSLLMLSQPFTIAQQTGWLVNLIDISDLRQALAQRDQAMHFISHDIRSPITAILTVIEMEQHFGATTVSADLIARIQRYAHSGLALADDFVHLARAQHSPARRERVELGTVIDQALDDTWAAAKARHVALDWMPQETEAWVLADASMLRRACVNLISNAIKYGPEAGTVHCTLTQEGPHWVVAVRDEGPGISPAEQARLFAPFARQQQHERSHIPGLGLGLAYVHTAAQQHGGHIAVVSAVGQGACFKLYVPCAEADSAALTQPASAAS